MTKNYIGIIGAMKPEVDILKEWMDITSTEYIAHVEVFVGTLDEKSVVLVESGIGKVNAAMITALLIERFDVRMIINTGVAGALSEQLNVTDMVVSTEVLHHDVDAREFGYELGQVPSMPRYYIADKGLVNKSYHAIQSIAGNVNGYKALIVSGDSFIANSKDKKDITDNFRRAFAVDMESASIAQTCYQFSIPFVIVRSISDKADDTADMTYDEFLKRACVNSSEVVKLLIKDL